MMAQKIAASIEVSPYQAAESTDLSAAIPAGTRVYMTDVGTDTTESIVKGAARLRDLGFVAVPHFASRRLTTRQALETRIRCLAEEAGVRDVLVIGGGLDQPAGEFTASMEVLETGLFDKYGIKHIGVAGHPEGTPDFSDETAREALRLKQAFAERSDAEMRIVTQFGFDPAGFIRWADGLKESGIDLPVHLGVAGPAKLTTLVKYAMMCGVGNSVNFIRRRAASVATMVKGFDPEEVVRPIEQHVNNSSRTAIRQVHVFPFGGVKKSAQWLRDRGSWNEYVPRRAQA
jgi:methylenetetrahydrofolate reductase (NADPH)